jgi:hypothetical protein
VTEGLALTHISGIHPYADTFPLLSEDELAELADSISVNGLRLPIVVTPEGLILDGRNRWRACELAEVEPALGVYEGDDLAEYVIDANITRRNMSTGARAMATALVLDADGQRIEGRWPDGAVKNLTGDVSPDTWKVACFKAGVILDCKRELADRIAAEKAEEERQHRVATHLLCHNLVVVAQLRGGTTARKYRADMALPGRAVTMQTWLDAQQAIKEGIAMWKEEGFE